MQIDRETVIQWAREHGVIDFGDTDNNPHAKQMIDCLMFVAKRAAEQERLECGRICDHFGSTFDALKAIRARAQDPHQ